MLTGQLAHGPLPDSTLLPDSRPSLWPSDPSCEKKIPVPVPLGSRRFSPISASRFPNPWTVRVPASHPANALAAYVKIGDELTLAAGVTLTVQQITTALDGYLVMRCTSEERAPM